MHTLRSTLLTLLPFSSLATAAFAHHPNGGEIPVNFGEGLLSGLAHPVIGLDHLAFILAISLVAAIHKKISMVISFVGASTIGVFVHLGGINIAYSELLVAASVVVIATSILKSEVIPASGIIGFNLLAGLLHGYAYGEAIVGAEPSSLTAYLMGLFLVQGVIGTIVMRLFINLDQSVQNRIRKLAFTTCAATGMALIIL